MEMARAGAALGRRRGHGVQLGQRGVLLAAAARLPPPAARAARRDRGREACLGARYAAGSVAVRRRQVCRVLVGKSR